MSETVFQNAAPTKIVSARLPIPEYIKILNAATEAKMSVSEFLYYKIYQEDKVIELSKALSDAESNAKTFRSKAEANLIAAQETAKMYEALKLASGKVQTEVSTLKAQISAANEAEKRYKGEIAHDGKAVSELNKTISELKAKVQQLETERKKLSDIVSQWAVKYDGLAKVCASVKAQVLEYIRTEMFGGSALKNIINKLP